MDMVRDGRSFGSSICYYIISWMSRQCHPRDSYVHCGGVTTVLCDSGFCSIRNCMGVVLSRGSCWNDGGCESGSCVFQNESKHGEGIHQLTGIRMEGSRGGNFERKAVAATSIGVTPITCRRGRRFTRNSGGRAQNGTCRTRSPYAGPPTSRSRKSSPWSRFLNNQPSKSNRDARYGLRAIKLGEARVPGPPHGGTRKERALEVIRHLGLGNESIQEEVEAQFPTPENIRAAAGEGWPSTPTPSEADIYGHIEDPGIITEGPHPAPQDLDPTDDEGELFAGPPPSPFITIDTDSVLLSCPFCADFKTPHGPGAMMRHISCKHGGERF